MNLSNSSYVNGTWVPWTPRSLNHTRITLWSILLVWSLLGNVLVIVVVYCNQNLRTNMNYLIVNMAVSDLLVPLVAVPWMMSVQLLRPLEWLVEGPLGEALCKLVPFLSNISLFVSSFNLVIIAFRRFIAIVYPTRMPISTRRKKWIQFSFPWIVGMAFLTPFFYTFRLIKFWGYTICHTSWSPGLKFWPAQVIFISTLVLMGFVIPLIAIIIFYVIIQHKLRKSLHNVMDLVQKEMILLRQRRNTRIFSMSVAIIVMFTICWSPLSVMNLLHATYHSIFSSVDIEISIKLNFAFSYLWFLQAAINPCIYFVFLRDFRKGLKRLWCKNTESAKEQIPRLCVCSERTVAPGGDSNQDTTCTPLHHINTTTV